MVSISTGLDDFCLPFHWFLCLAGWLAGCSADADAAGPSPIRFLLKIVRAFVLSAGNMYFNEKLL